MKRRSKLYGLFIFLFMILFNLFPMKLREKETECERELVQCVCVCVCQCVSEREREGANVSSVLLVLASARTCDQNVQHKCSSSSKAKSDLMVANVLQRIIIIMKLASLGQEIDSQLYQVMARKKIIKKQINCNLILLFGSYGERECVCLATIIPK